MGKGRKRSWRGLEVGRRKKKATHLDMHRRLPSYMQSNLGKSLHILKSRRFVRSKGMCSGVYHQLSSGFLTSRERRVLTMG
jgi:hypothetical protein